jgi:NAD(P)-dependent dehydrogenase (short-subunit alcohol dehydrogenase family)
VTVMRYEAPALDAVASLEDELADAFALLLAALERGEPVVVLLDDRDVQGNGTPAGAALAHGLLGLVRALAIEGRRPGWRVNALAATPDVDDAERELWVRRLGEPAAAVGALVRLGAGHLGRLPA